MKKEGDIMKRSILIPSLLAIALFVTGCSNEKKDNKILNCSSKETIVDGIKTNSSYKVTHDGEYVRVIEIEETVMTTDTKYLETIKKTIETMYMPYNNVKYYEYSVNIQGDTLISTSKIDYSKINMDELLEINPEMSIIIEDGKLRVYEVEKIYNQKGITCK